MLPKNQRINLKTGQRLEIFSSKNKVFSGNFAIHHAKNSEKLQAAAIVPKHRIALSTGRNSIKRMIYQQIYQDLRDEKISLIVQYKGEKAFRVSTKLKENIKSDLITLLQKIKCSLK